MTTESVLVAHLRGELRDLNLSVKDLRRQLAEQRALVAAFEARVKVSVPRATLAAELRRLVQTHIEGEPGLSEKLFDLALQIEGGTEL